MKATEDGPHQDDWPPTRKSSMKLGETFFPLIFNSLCLDCVWALMYYLQTVLTQNGSMNWIPLLHVYKTKHFMHYILNDKCLPKNVLKPNIVLSKYKRLLDPTEKLELLLPEFQKDLLWTFFIDNALCDTCVKNINLI